MPLGKRLDFDRIRDFREKNDVEIMNSRNIYSPFFETRFLKLVQNFFKVVFVCFVSFGKRPDFDRIRESKDKNDVEIINSSNIYSTFFEI